MDNDLDEFIVLEIVTINQKNWFNSDRSSKIMYKDRITIQKKYVHKTNEENVFLYNLRRKLPLTIAKDIFESNLKSAVSEDEYEYLLRAVDSQNREGEAAYLTIR